MVCVVDEIGQTYAYVSEGVGVVSGLWRNVHEGKSGVGVVCSMGQNVTYSNLGVGGGCSV